MNFLHTKVKWHFRLVHLDNIVVFWRTPDEHIKHVLQVLKVLNSASITLSPKKCELFFMCMDYLGHVISPGVYQMSTRTTDSMHGPERPINLTEVRLFLGM